MRREGDRERWDARHAAADDPDPPPSAIMAAAEEMMPVEGRGLDLACGRGRNAVALARRGLDVVGVDVSPVALACLRDLAALHGVGAHVTTVEHDLTRGLPDLGATFDVVLCLNFRQPALWPRLPALVAKDGLLVMQTLARDATNLDVDCDYLAERDELLGAARGLDILVHGRAKAGRRVVDRLVARRVR